MNKTLLWLDDIRNPFDNIWNEYIYKYITTDNLQIVWVKSFLEFTEYINELGLPEIIAFDHDLGLNKSGYDAAKWLIEYCLDNNRYIPLYIIQSSNPAGRENIDGILKSFKKFQNIVLKDGGCSSVG